MTYDPLGYARLWWSAAELTCEASIVASLRIWSMAGGLPKRRDEDRRMWAEKGPAFARSAAAAQRAWFGGATPDRVIGAAMEPIAEVAAANRRRLTSST